MNGEKMAHKLNLGPEIRELKLGPTFLNPNATAFHTLRYDFKPASVDVNKMATVDVGSNQQVTVTVPHQDGSGTTQTVFKGPHRPYTRECVLIYDKITGEVILERLSTNIQLKKTRMGPSKTSPHAASSGSSKQSAVRSATPLEKKKPPKRQCYKSPMNLGRPLPKHSPLPASPSYANNKSPTVYKSPPQALSSLSLSPVAPGSLPMIGLDDPLDNLPNSLSQSPYYNMDQEEPALPMQLDPVLSRVGILSASSSSNSSSEGDSSDSDSDSPATNSKQKLTNGHVNGNIPATDLLTADLELSEDSGSDSS